MHWPLIIVRSILTWVTGFLVTVLGAAVVLPIALLNETSPMIEKVIRVWSRTWLIASGTRLEVRGQDNVDTNRSYVVVANHQSTLDIMACFLALPVPIRYLAKKELFKIPILAQAMRAVGIIEVDRTARSSIHASVNRQAEELIRKRRSIIIYAEGTRPRDGIMRSFKKGAFAMAVGGGLPILPVAIHGTFEASSPGRPWFRGGAVTVTIDPAIETAGLGQNDIEGLRNRVHGIIAGRVREMGGRVAA